MAVVNTYIKVVVRRISSISFMIICKFPNFREEVTLKLGEDWYIILAITTENEKTLCTTTLIYLFTTTLHNMVSISFVLRALFKFLSRFFYIRVTWRCRIVHEPQLGRPNFAACKIRLWKHIAQCLNLTSHFASSKTLQFSIRVLHATNVLWLVPDWAQLNFRATDLQFQFAWGPL